MPALRSAIALATLLLVAACSDRSRDSARTDSATTHVAIASRAASADPAPLAAGDVRIVTTDGGMDLALIGDTISSGLSPDAMEKARHGTDTASVTGTGFGADLEKMVKGTVQKAIGTRVVFPIADVREVRYDGHALAFEWMGKPPRVYSSMKVNGKPFLESFAPDDAKRFADAVMARKTALGH
jgi:hypothetical protein